LPIDDFVIFLFAVAFIQPSSFCFYLIFKFSLVC
jgi:hypothetical protein